MVPWCPLRLITLEFGGLRLWDGLRLDTFHYFALLGPQEVAEKLATEEGHRAERWGDQRSGRILKAMILYPSMALFLLARPLFVLVHPRAFVQIAWIPDVCCIPCRKWYCPGSQKMWKSCSRSSPAKRLLSQGPQLGRPGEGADISLFWLVRVGLLGMLCPMIGGDLVTVLSL